MSESTEQLAFAALVNRVREEQNKIEEQRREKFLAGTLFHPRAIASGDFLQNHGPQLEEEFLREKKGKSMLERFHMALSDKYFGMIHVVELGVTTEPSASGEIDGLKDEYAQLRDFMISTGLIEDDRSREESGRTLTVAPAPVTNGLVIISRNRPLISQTVAHTFNEKDPPMEVGVGIAKRMVFSIPTSLYVAIVDRFNDPKLESEEAIRCIEGLLEKRDNNVFAIRTAYHLISELA